MAISRLAGQDAKGTGAAGTASATYPGATTVGNLLIATAFGNVNTALAITGWTLRQSNASISINLSIFDKIADGTETTVTVTGSAAATRIHIYEYTGNANPINVDTSNNGTGASASSAATSSITTTNANDLIFASMSMGAAVTSPSATAPFNLRQVDAASIRLIDADQIVAATGTYAATFSWTTAATNRNAIVAYKAAGATPNSNFLQFM